MARYRLHQTGPDDNSTFRQCFGPNPAPGPVVAEADRLADLIETADGMGHTNWHIRDSHRREDIHPHEFWQRECVKKAIPKPED